MGFKLYKGKKHFNQLRDSPSGLAMWAASEHRDSEQVNIIRNTLNDYELISIGIQEKILDERLYKRWFRHSFLKDYRAAYPFILEVRRQEGVDTIFDEMQWLTERWGTRDELPDKQTKTVEMS